MLIYEEPASGAGEHAASKLIVRAQKSEHAIVLIEITSKKIMWSNYGVRSSICLKMRFVFKLVMFFLFQNN